MNLLLIEAEELDDAGIARIAGRRAKHLRRVLKVTPGQTLRGGILDGARVSLTVVSLEDDGSVVLEVGAAVATDPVAVARGLELIIALPRPQVLHRVLQFAASMGVSRIDLIGAWRVEKSFFQSPSLEARRVRRQLRLGAEQGMTTRVPTVEFHHRFVPFLDQLRSRPAALRLLGDPTGAPIESVFGPLAPAETIQLAIGPEGGFIDREVDSFVALGFRATRLGPWILRVEAALVAMLAQIHLLDRTSPPSAKDSVG